MIDTGGQAFPCTGDPQQLFIFAQEGMTLRDHYVGLFMAALITKFGPDGPAKCVSIAQEYADAAIKGRWDEQPT